ncbi:MAG: pyrimidine dimer DNA glycosylase/endonuclease V [Oscillospiraceae bacterium]|nr:pyrimidine dimer DNA glycosylase/endonuclease V [Oscillospiraceae bacterium]
MRLWSWQLLPYLPDLQLRGQLMELVGLMHEWRDKGTTNHLVVNKVMEYPKSELSGYFKYYKDIMRRRYGNNLDKYIAEFRDFSGPAHHKDSFFDGWHDREYMRVCMANLYEKYRFGVGKSRITQEQWEVLCIGYKKYTGEDYKI